MQVLPQCGHAVHEDSPDKVDIQSNLPMWSPIFKDHFSDRFYVQWQSTPLYCMKCLILQDDCKYEYLGKLFRVNKRFWESGIVCAIVYLCEGCKY